MNKYQYKNLTIEVLDETTYKFDSTDNNFNYDKHYFGDGGQEYPLQNTELKFCRTTK